MPQVEVDQLCRVFKVPEREGGLRAALGSVFRRRYRQVLAVDRVSFSIEAGEIVGFLGPNGAGKTTTLKMLSGLLHPTSGRAQVLGHIPWRREAEYLRRISMVMGQRNQLAWDLPALDSFLVLLAVYRVDREEGRRTMQELIDLLEIGPAVRKQLRTLSLGERMKCEIAASLLHRPQVVFMDEPTLGLDVTMQDRIRSFIRDYNRRYGGTIVLTSHYMADVTALCRRVIVIDHGRILFDGPLAALSARMAPFKVITIDLDRMPGDYAFDRLGTVLECEGRKIKIRVPKASAAEVTGRLLADLPVMDLTIEEPPIEDVIKQVFATGVESSL